MCTVRDWCAECLRDGSGQQTGTLPCRVLEAWSGVQTLVWKGIKWGNDILSGLRDTVCRTRKTGLAGADEVAVTLEANDLLGGVATTVSGRKRVQCVCEWW